MTSSNTLKKIVSLGAVALLAVGGSFTGSSPASAADINTATVVSAPQGGSTSVTLSVTGCQVNAFANPTPAPEASDFTVIGGAGALAVSSVSLGSYISLSMASPLVAGDNLAISYVKNATSTKQIPCTIAGNVVGSFSGLNTTVASAPPTITGTSGNLNGTVGVALSMPAYITTGLTSPVVFSYTLSNGSSLPAGVTFNTSTGQMIGTPTASMSNLGVSITATGANNLTANVGFNFTVTGGGGGGGVSNCNPAVTVNAIGWSSGSIGTSGTVRTIYNNDPSIGTSTLCFATMVDMSLLTTVNGVVVGTPTRYPTYGMGISSSPVTLSMLLTNPSLSSLTISDGDVYTNNYYVSLGRVPTLSDTPTFSRSLILNPGVGGSSVVSTPRLSVEQARNVLKPVPAAVQPLVPGFLALNKPIASLGGKVALSAGDFTGLVSAKIAGKSLDFILGNTGKITMTVPQGEAGKTADLVLTFNTGSIILQDAIKYVAPLDIAKVGVRPISIAAGAKKISDGVADQIRQAAFANAKNDTIQCIAYSASNSSAAIAAAKLTAVQACGVAVKANSDLKVADVVVVVDKLKARTQGVGIKVYKADN